MENPNADDEASRYEEPIPYTPLRETPAPLPIARPGLVGLAEALMLLVFAVEMNALSYDPSMQNWGIPIGIGCALSLPPMLVVWSSVRSGVGRFLLAVLLALLNSYFAGSNVDMRFTLVFVSLLVSSVPVWVVLSTIKQNVGRFVPLERRDEQFFGGLRFSLSQLLIVTTVLAILLPIGKYLWPMLSGVEGYLNRAFFLFNMIVLISFNTLMFVWALLGKEVSLRICVAVSVAVVTWVVCNLLGAPNPEYAITGLPLVLTFTLMAAFRFSGWRFVRGTPV